jgi:hypothetical protein
MPLTHICHLTPADTFDTAAIRAAHRDLSLHVAVAAQEPLRS